MLSTPEKGWKVGREEGRESRDREKGREKESLTGEKMWLSGTSGLNV